MHVVFTFIESDSKSMSNHFSENIIPPETAAMMMIPPSNNNYIEREIKNDFVAVNYLQDSKIEKVITPKEDSKPLTRSNQNIPTIKDIPPKKEVIVSKKVVKNIFTAEEVSKHNTLEDCWMILNGKVYDITNFISLHPGGKRSLLTFGGKDASSNIEFHSSAMLKIAKDYYIGDLAGYKQPSSCVIS